MRNLEITGREEVTWGCYPFQIFIFTCIFFFAYGSRQTGPCQPNPWSQSLMVFSSIRPLWAKGLVPWVIVIYASSPSGCKMVLIRCMPCLLSHARGRLGARLVHHEREGDLHGSQQHVFNLWGIYWPSIRLLSTVYTVPNSSKTNGRLNFFFH